MKKRKIGVIVGSDSDLKQCVKGLEHLIEKYTYGKVELTWVDTASQHRNPLTVTGILSDYASYPENDKVDVLIIGAGMANHLSCCSDAILRNILKDNHIVVIAVAFEDKANPEHTKAAVYSIKYVPGTQAVFKDYIGAQGFWNACCDAFEMELPEIKLRPVKPWIRRTFWDALAEGKKLLEIDEQKKLTAT
mgnify:CR=1 FL=1